MPILDDIRQLDVQAAQVNLWTVKGPTGAIANDPTYSARWVDITAEVEITLKTIFSDEIGRIEEILEFGLLAQNHETSVMSIPVDETHANILLAAVAAETPANKVSRVKQLLNSKFYIAKFIFANEIVYGVKQTSNSWKTAKANAVRSVFFADEVLAIDQRPILKSASGSIL